MESDNTPPSYLSPHSATVVGDDHLSYFAMLGRIMGLALYHKEPLNAQLSDAFIKTVMGFEIVPEDLESVDPDLYEKRIVYLRDSLYRTKDNMELEDLCLTFVDDSNVSTCLFCVCALSFRRLSRGAGRMRATQRTKAPGAFRCGAASLPLEKRST